MLEIKNLTVRVKNDTPILTDVSLSIDEGSCIGLTGASGSGKTTLIKSIMGMNSGDLEITQGQILLDGDNLLIHGAKEREDDWIYSTKPNDSVFSTCKDGTPDY